MLCVGRGLGVGLVMSAQLAKISLAMAMKVVTLVLLLAVSCVVGRQFTIDYDHDTFLKDGQPFRQVLHTQLARRSCVWSLVV